MLTRWMDSSVVFTHIEMVPYEYLFSNYSCQHAGLLRNCCTCFTCCTAILISICQLNGHFYSYTAYTTYEKIVLTSRCTVTTKSCNKKIKSFSTASYQLFSSVCLIIMILIKMQQQSNMLMSVSSPISPIKLIRVSNL